MIINKILPLLRQVKNTGHGRYTALCPHHKDKHPSLAITEKGDTVLIKCWAGCDTADVLAAIGLTLADLYPEKPQYTKAKTVKFNAYDVLNCLQTESLVVMLGGHDAINGVLTGENLKRLELAYQRISDAHKVVFGG